MTLHKKIWNCTRNSLPIKRSTEDILSAIVLSYVILLLVAFIFLFYLNRAKNKKLWSPFFSNLGQIKRFSLRSESSIELESSEILEFSELNKEITTLTEKVRADYKNLKQFTGDISHEMQTPLAIIQAKIENFINDNRIDEKQYEQLTSIQKDINRLTQLNKRLLLLTKIDNNQFVTLEEVNISELVKKSIQNFIELSPTKIIYSGHDEIKINMDPYLAEVLCNNLLSNAIKHNSNTKDILVFTRDNTLSISNYGKKSLEHPEKLFTRFYKEAKGAASSGLGLAIVKKICERYGFAISYNYTDQNHVFSVDFV